MALGIKHLKNKLAIPTFIALLFLGNLFQFPNHGRQISQLSIYCKDGNCNSKGIFPQSINATTTQNIDFFLQNDDCSKIVGWKPLGEESIKIEKNEGALQVIFPVWKSKTQDLSNKFTIRIPVTNKSCIIKFKIENSRKYILELNGDLVYSQRYNEPVFGLGKIELSDTEIEGYIKVAIHSKSSRTDYLQNLMITILMIVLSVVSTSNLIKRRSSVEV